MNLDMSETKSKLIKDDPVEESKEVSHASSLVYLNESETFT